MRVKVTDLPKDGSVSVRINKEIKESLQKEGVSLQKIFDSAIEKLLNRRNTSAGKKSK